MRSQRLVVDKPDEDIVKIQVDGQDREDSEDRVLVGRSANGKIDRIPKKQLRHVGLEALGHDRYLTPSYMSSPKFKSES